MQVLCFPFIGMNPLKNQSKKENHKMKKRLFALTAMMLCIVMALSSCSLFASGVKFKNFVDKDYQPDVDPSLTTLEKLDISGNLDDSDGVSKLGNVIILQGRNKTTDRTTFTVYNVATNKVIWKGENYVEKLPDGEETVSYSLQKKTVYLDDAVNEVTCLVIVVKETRTVTSFSKTVYDVTVWAENGTEVVTLKDVDRSKVLNSIWTAADLFSIQEKVYRLSKDGSAEFAFDWSSARTKPTGYLTKAGDYYIDYHTHSYQYSVSIYDSCLNTVATYMPPVYDVIDETSLGDLRETSHVLSNGNVIVQYIVGQDVMAEKFDFILLGGKYTMHTVMLEAKTGKLKELKLDYILEEVMFGEALKDMGVNKEIENVAVGYPIEDQRINQNATAAKLISLKNDGKIAGVLELPIMGMTVEDGITAVAHNRWVIEAVNGRTYLVNENGDVIGEDFDVSNRNGDLFLMGNRIYNWDMDVICDLTGENIESIYVMNHGVFFKTKEGAYKLFANGELKTIADENAASDGKRMVRYLCSGAYVIIDASDPAGTKYEIYNDVGVLLDTVVLSGTPEVFKTTYNGAILLRSHIGSEIVYYRIG